MPQTTRDRPWRLRLLIILLLAAAFGGWWWMLQRTLDNERQALSSRLELEAEQRFELALKTVRSELARDQGEARDVVQDPLELARLIEQERLSAFLIPEDEFKVIEGALPDKATLEAGEVEWGSTESGRDPIASKLLERRDEPMVRAVLRERLMGQAGPPMKASFHHRCIERFLQGHPDAVLADLGAAHGWWATGELPPNGVTSAQGRVTLWWSERQIMERFERAGVQVTLGENGQRFTPWPSPVRAELVIPDVATTAFSNSGSLVRWIGLGSGLLFATAVIGALWSGWRDSKVARLRTDLAASFAHELRTPLAGQRLLIESLLGPIASTSEKQEDYLKRALASNQRLGSLAEQFLTFSRLDRGVLRVDRVETNVLELVEESLEAGKHSFETCEIDIPQNLTAYLDRGAVGSILGNLIENAWKYSPGHKWLAIRARKTGEALQLEVEDHGEGFEPGHRRKAFRQFWRAESGLHRKVDGLGLGLTIVAQLTKAHGGEVMLESEAGRGSTFRVILAESDP